MPLFFFAMPGFYILAVYILDICMVSIDFLITLRNRRLDRLAEMENQK